jgi:subtilase family serine protease
MPKSATSTHLRFGTLAAISLAASLAGAQSPVSTLRSPLTDSVVPVLNQSRVLGHVPSAERIQVTISLQPRDQAGLEAYANAVSDPRSPLYHQFLTPAQVGEKFGASAADRAAVVSYLASKGMTVTLAAPNGMAVIAEGPATNAEAAFGTRLAYYQGTDGVTKKPTTFRANATPVTLPPGLAKTVTNVSGLETFSRPKPRVTTLTPVLIDGLYNLKLAHNSGYNGQGRNIAISNFDGFRLSNVPLYTSRYGLPVPTGGSGSNIQVVTVGTGAQNGTAQGEGDLDIQMVIASAPLANIRIYDSTTDIIGVLTREATDNWADVVTESYGWSLSTTTAQAAHNQHLAMTAQGITYSAASGDSGTDMTPYSYPNYDPEVLQVGGTIADVNSTTGVRNTEVGWSGSGGGWVYNTLSWNTLPAWQRGTGVPTNINRRLVPDIALHAAGSNNNGGAYYIYYNGALYSFLGTSCASPLFAGSLGVVEQRLVSAGKSARQGRLQDFIYGQNGTSSVYFDIKSGSNGRLPKTANSNTLNGSTSSAKAGWDYVTGWGSIDFDAFYNALLNRTTP